MRSGDTTPQAFACSMRSGYISPKMVVSYPSTGTSICSPISNPAAVFYAVQIPLTNLKTPAAQQSAERRCLWRNVVINQTD